MPTFAFPPFWCNKHLSHLLKGEAGLQMEMVRGIGVVCSFQLKSCPVFLKTTEKEQKNSLA